MPRRPDRFHAARALATSSQADQEDEQMTDTSHRSAGATERGYDEPSGWAGWVVFGALMLIMLSIFQIMQALVALFDDGFYLVRSNGLVVDVDYNTWGWIHMTIGVIGIIVGLGLLAGNMAARVAGVVIAFLNALVNLAFISAYPVWSTLLIVLDVIVIYAIIVHGRELKAGPYR
jgi:hypothetical protein